MRALLLSSVPPSTQLNPRVLEVFYLDTVNESTRVKVRGSRL
jgi:hypothetical protein